MKSYIINGLVVLFILSIIPATVYLVRQQQILKSRASLDQSVVFFGEGVSEKDGQYIATKLEGIKVKLTSPITQPEITPPPVSINEAEPQSMECPENAAFNPGQQIPVKVTMKNTGSAIWNDNYRLGLLDGNDPGNPARGDALSQILGTYHLPLSNQVKPQEQTTVSFNLTAPRETGNYLVQWRMIEEGKEWFGGKSKQCSFSVANKATLTPTPPPVPSKPADPTGLSVNCPAPGTAAGLSWNGVAGADTYTIWAFDHVPISADWAACTQGPNICGYTVEGTNANNLPTWAGVKYRWYVFACNSSECSPNGASTTQLCAAPAATPRVTPTPNPTPTPIPTPSTTSLYTPIGFMDTANCNFINGWACDQDNYNARLDIHFYDGQPGAGGKFIGNITANAQRESGVGDQCGGNSNHGFFFAVPDSVKDGQSHNIYAYAINYPTNEGNPLLSGAPKTISCGSVQGIAKAAEHPYTVSFKVAKSPEDLEKADPKDYDADPKYIDYTFSGNPTSGTTETLYVEFIGQGGEKETRQVTITYRPTVMVTPSPDPGNFQKQVWFTPNLGSADMLDLFRNFDQWTSARSKINVFKFYSQQVTLTDPSQCSQCGQNLLPNLINAGAFSKLTNSGIGIAFEAGVLKPGNCTTADGNNKPVAFTTVSMNGINNIQTNGGIVRYIAMDEPYIGGTGNPGNGQNPCKFTMEQSAFRTTQYRNLVKQAYPGVEIGDIEPYPYFSADELKKWISEFKKYNIKLAFFHLDVDMALVKTRGKNLAADLQDLQAFTENQGIPFGVIFIGNWPDESQISNKVYYESTLTNVRIVKSAIGMPTHSIFQSWWEYPSGLNQLPINLPENNSDIYSHTRLLNEGYQILSPNQSSAVEANSEKPNPVIEIIQSIPLVGALFSTPEPTSQPTPYPTPSHTPSFIPVAASTPVPTPSVQTDFNSDGKVNAVDLSILFSSWGKKNSKTDINRDGIVNSLDYTLFLRSYRH